MPPIYPNTLRPGTGLSRLAVTLLSTLLLALGFLQAASAAIYYSDPVNGSMSNSGGAAAPWASLQAIGSSSKTFGPGDIIYLRSGYHGAVNFGAAKTPSSGSATIRPQTGHQPILARLTMHASNWTVEGLVVTGEANNTWGGTLVQVHGSNVKIWNNLVYSASNIQNWTASTWVARMGVGINHSGANGEVYGNVVRNVRYGINIGADDSVASYNLIENIGTDGMHVHGDDSLVEYNMIREFYSTDGLHRDGIQGWDHPNYGTMYRTTIRGNTILNSVRADRTDSPTTQGIGLFDGLFRDMVIENNLVAVTNHHGITILGSTNGKILSNTVIHCPLRPVHTPYIRVADGKNGSASLGNLIRNNLTASFLNETNPSPGTIDHNVVSTNYANLFQNYNGYDFRLKTGSAAIGAGSTSGVPSIDIAARSRVSPYDVGANEFLTSVATPVFTRRGGTFAGDQTVAITCATSGATIRYTLNGSRPSATNGINYTGPVVVTSPVLFKAVGIRSGMANSDVAVEGFSIAPLTIDALTSYYNEQLKAARTGTFTVQFDATPSRSPMDASVALSNSAITHANDMSTMARFNPSGRIDARNGTTFAAAQVIPYSAGQTYRFRLVVNVSTRTYSIYVKPPTGPELVVGTNFGFRKTAVSNLTHWNGIVWSSLGGNLKVANLKTTP